MAFFTQKKTKIRGPPEIERKKVFKLIHFFRVIQIDRLPQDYVKSERNILELSVATVFSSVKFPKL